MSGVCVKSLRKGKLLDLFCWKCHKTETNFGCNRCERSFHIKCISLTKTITDFSSNWVCNECKPSNQFQCPLDSIQLREIMLSSLKVISKSADYYFNSDKCFSDKRIKINSSFIVNPLNLKTIEEKVNEFQYKSFREMMSDFKWILHNCIIGEMESELIENAKFLLSKVKSELSDFEECVYCFINYYKTSKSKYYSWFAKPCPQLHHLIWAKLKGHPIWPSKAIKYNEQNNSILVRFFGTQQKAWVKEKECFKITEENLKPLKGKALQMSKLFDSALEEMRFCIKYLNEEYPNTFKYWPKFTPFSIKDMISVDIKLKNSNPNRINGSEAQNHSNDWRPKARKTFPTPTYSNNTETNTNYSKITFKSTNDNKSKAKQNIVIIEFNSESFKESSKREINDSNENNKTNKKQKFEYISQQNNIKISPIEPIIGQDFNNSNIVPKEEIISESIDLNEEISTTDSKLLYNNSLEYLEREINELQKMIKIKDDNYEKQIIKMKTQSDLELEQTKRSLSEMIDKQRTLIEERNKQIVIINEKLKEMETQKNQLIEKHNKEIKLLEEKYEKDLSDSKTKIWCFSCQKEAQLFCCSHTYYCSNECQLNHWITHKQICKNK